jgi:hypothetical protein
MLTIAVLALAFSFQHIQNPGENHASHYAPNQEPQDVSFWIRTVGDPVSLFTFVLAISTLGLWVVTWRSGVRQSRQTRESLREARRNTAAFMSAEKANVFIEIKESTVAKIVGSYGLWDKTTSMFPDVVESPCVAYFFSNIGRTAAIIREISNQLVFLADFPNGADYSIREPFPERPVIMPDKTSDIFVCCMEDAMTVGKCVDFQAQRGAFWFYGYVIFADVFGRQHEWRYRFSYKRGYGGFRLDYFREFTESEDDQES